jgi:hypothetical protein
MPRFHQNICDHSSMAARADQIRDWLCWHEAIGGSVVVGSENNCGSVMSDVATMRATLQTQWRTTREM